MTNKISANPEGYASISSKEQTDSIEVPIQAPTMNTIKTSHAVALTDESMQKSMAESSASGPNVPQTTQAPPTGFQARNRNPESGSGLQKRIFPGSTASGENGVGRASLTSDRYTLRNRVRVLNDVLVVLAMGGLLLAVVVNQLITSEAFGDVNEDVQINHPALIAMRTAISVSTIAALVVDLLYHWTQLRVRLMDLAEKPPLATIRLKDVSLSLIELFVCAVHPIPWDFRVTQTVISYSPPERYYQSPINVNFFLTAFMFLRVHLVVRAVLMHHPLYRSPAAHMFGPLHKVSVGYGFLFRVLMDSYALSVMCICIVIYWLCTGWIFMQCESVAGVHTGDYLNAIWFIVVTFTTVSSTIRTFVTHSRTIRETGSIKNMQRAEGQGKTSHTL